MEGLICVRAYKWRNLYTYLRGPINGGTYIWGGLQIEGLISARAYNRNRKNISKHAIAVLIKVQFALTWFLTSCKISFQYIILKQKLRGAYICVGWGGGELGLYTTSTFPIMHLICPPKFCITFVFHFYWVLQPSQEKLKTMLRWNLRG